MVPADLLLHCFQETICIGHSFFLDKGKDFLPITQKSRYVLWYDNADWHSILGVCSKDIKTTAPPTGFVGGAAVMRLCFWEYCIRSG